MTPQELTPGEISFLFERIKKDIDRCNEAERKLFHYQDRKTWVECYKQRSRTLREAFDHNNEVYALFYGFISGECELTPELADIFAKEQLAMDVSRYDDPFIVVKGLQTLINYFLPSGDLSRILPLYNRLGWETSTTIRMGYEENFELALSCYKNILKHRDQYFSLTDPALRRLFFVAYHNIITVFASFNHPLMTLDETVPYLRELREFYYSDEVQKLDGNNDAIRSLVRYTQEQWLALEKNLEDSSPETINFFCDVAFTVYDNQLKADGDLYEISSEAVIARQRALVVRGSITYTEAIKYLLDYYEERRRRTKDITIPENYEIDRNFYFQSRIPATIFNLFDQDPDCDPEFKHNTIRYLIECKNEFFKKITRSTSNYSPYINESLADWTLQVFEQLETIEEKEEILFNNIINRQIATYFHSHMVETISEMFVDSLFKYRPDLLLPVVEAHSVSELHDLTDGIREYIRKSALLHDIGKNFIPDVINMQTRRLTDEEFAVIKKHPRIGAESIDEDFILYHDIILGHHRSYDCRSGYPMEFDPSGSSVKIIIDLIAICDSLDAATDYLGRNYAIRKDLSTVVRELREGAGTRYNPDLVALIETDEDLYNRLNELITHGREDLYYDLFLEQFMEKQK